MWCSLIGFMGVGKSTVADVLAARAVVAAVDLDDLIVARESATIADLFAERGEPAFREAEYEALLSMQPEREVVLACGGGVVEQQRNVALLRERGVVIWLDCPWEILRIRLDREGDAVRPLVANLGWEGLHALYLKRLRLYAAAAHFRLRADQGDAEVLARRVMACRLNWMRQRNGASA